MTLYAFAFTGGSIAETEEAQAASLAAWTAWFESMGDALKDLGAPFAASATVASDGSVTPAGASTLTGYSVIDADSLDAAVAFARTCPNLADGGAVEVYETIDMTPPEG